MTEETQQPMSKEERTWGMLCHLAGLALFVIPSIGQIIGPLVVWLIKKDEYPFVNSQGKESLNFQISMTIYAFVSLILIVTIPLILVIALYDVIQVIIASVQASEGRPYRYPLTIRLVK